MHCALLNVFIFSLRMMTDCKLLNSSFLNASFLNSSFLNASSYSMKLHKSPTLRLTVPHPGRAVVEGRRQVAIGRQPKPKGPTDKPYRTRSHKDKESFWEPFHKYGDWVLWNRQQTASFRPFVPTAMLCDQTCVKIYQMYGKICAIACFMDQGHWTYKFWTFADYCELEKVNCWYKDFASYVAVHRGDCPEQALENSTSFTAPTDVDGMLSRACFWEGKIRCRLISTYRLEQYPTTPLPSREGLLGLVVDFVFGPPPPPSIDYDYD